MLVKCDLVNTTQPRQQKGKLVEISKKKTGSMVSLAAGWSSHRPTRGTEHARLEQGRAPTATDLSQLQMNHMAVIFPQKITK